jgi:hypothetical protein
MEMGRSNFLEKGVRWRTVVKRLVMLAYSYGLLSKAAVEAVFSVLNLKHI